MGLYLHIPFCRSKCPYCDFYSLPLDEDLADRYVAALRRALAHPGLGERPVDTVYFGGGTPTLLGARRLCALLEEIARRFRLDAGAEITLEANPASLRASDWKELQEGGFTRASLGVQSGVEGELRALGRRHTVREAAAAVEAAAAGGFRELSVDLMLGIPGQTPESLEQSVDRLTALPVTHLSAYLLKVEEGTPFYRHGVAVRCPGEDESAALYLGCVSLLSDRGFPQYEISNFAPRGHESRHNLKYWRCQEYLGLGPSAHSFLEGQRFFLPRDLEGFLAAPDPLSLAVPDGPGGTAQEWAMLRLRLTEGLDLGELAARFGADTAPMAERAAFLADRGLMRVGDRRIAMTPEGFLLSNAVTAELLWDFEEEEKPN